MRQKIKTILVAIAMIMVIPTMAYSQTEKEVKKWERVMNAIIQVESEGNPKAHNPVGNCAGILQITPILVKECNNILKKKKSTKRYTLGDRYNVEKSKEMFIYLQEHFNPELNVEKAIKQWNCGFYTKQWKTKSIGYYTKVIKHY
jgi:hypothetical protein